VYDTLLQRGTYVYDTLLQRGNNLDDKIRGGIKSVARSLKECFIS